MKHAEAKLSDTRIAMPHAPQLDGIRAIAVMLVFAAHAGYAHIVPGGFGVTIFFFLSGYLITSLLRSEAGLTGDISFRNFYLRRTLRIIPPLIITYFVVMLLCWSGLIIDPIHWSRVPSQFLFYANYLTDPQGLPHLAVWSLAVEEHFYLLFPLIFAMVLRKRTGREAALLCAVVCAAALFVRVYNVCTLADFHMNYQYTHTRIDSILFGCCLAVWNNPILDRGQAYKPKPSHVAVALAVILFCLFYRNERFRESLRYTLQGGALFVLFSFALQGKGLVKKMLSSKPAQLLGLYSYSIYLIHPSAIKVFEYGFPAMPSLIRIALAFAATILYAMAMYYCVERPCANLRRALQPKVQKKRRSDRSEAPVAAGVEL